MNPLSPGSAILQHQQIPRPVLLMTGEDDLDISAWQQVWASINPCWNKMQIPTPQTMDSFQDWLSAVDEMICLIGSGVMLVASGYSALAIAHWTARSSRTNLIHSALLVDVPTANLTQTSTWECGDLQLFFPYPCMVVLRQLGLEESAFSSQNWALSHEARWIDERRQEASHLSNDPGWLAGYNLLMRLAAFE